MSEDMHNRLKELLLDRLRNAGLGEPIVRKEAFNLQQVYTGLSVIPEDEIDGGGTNATDDTGYPFTVIKIQGVSTNTPDFEFTKFRRRVRKMFHNKKVDEESDVYVARTKFLELYLPRLHSAKYQASAIRVTFWVEETREE